MPSTALYNPSIICEDEQKRIYEKFCSEITEEMIEIKYPHLATSTDGVVVCECHKKRLLEIKCPYNYRGGLIDWEKEKTSFVRQSHSSKIIPITLKFYENYVSTNCQHVSYSFGQQQASS